MKSVVACLSLAIWLLIAHLPGLKFQEANNELYLSADQVVRWTQASRDIYKRLEGLIENQEWKLQRLRRVQRSLKPLLPTPKAPEKELNIQETEAESPDKTLKYTKTPLRVNLMANPVSAFVTISRLRRAVEELEVSTESAADDIQRLLEKIRSAMVIDEELVGSAKALIRLQSFYDIRMRDVINGSVAGTWDDGHDQIDAQRSTYRESRLKMDALDCFELGKVAYGEQHFGMAIQWLSKALEMIYNDERDETAAGEAVDEFEFVINEILDYMAFAAYKLNMVEYSAKLTRGWLERDPENERAQENLEYYLDLLNDGNQTRKVKGASQEEAVQGHGRDDHDDDDDFGNRKYSDGRDILDDYSPTSDQVLRQLCRRPDGTTMAGDSRHKCQLNHSPLTQDGRLFEPGVKLETLNEEPEVVRVHEIISREEAAYFRRAALPKLERSTINSGAGLKTSDFRIAKTAWLPKQHHELVARVERRLASVIGFNLDKSEHFQVVNYGLGGFYGPHLDSVRSVRARKDVTEHLGQRADVEGGEAIDARLSEFQQNDRLATILIYLNRVEAGGATVFPRLNLTVAPIERSAVVWFNLKPSGHSDERTLHTGCPVLLGSKWIATKWPCERDNKLLARCRAADKPLD